MDSGVHRCRTAPLNKVKMKLTSKLKEIPGWIYNVEVHEEYVADSPLEGGVGTLEHPAIRYMEANYLTTSGLIIAHCRMSFDIDTEDIFQITGSSIVLNFGLSGSIAFEVDKLVPLHPAVLNNHAISYTPFYDGRYLMPARERIHYTCIIILESFYFALLDKRLPLHKDFVSKVLKREHAYYSPPMRVTPAVRSVLNEILSANKQGLLSRLLLETKIREILLLQLDQFLREENIRQPDRVHLESDRTKLADAKRILDGCFATPPLIPELARMVLLNEYKLKAGFKTYYGMTIHQYVIQLKMKMALSLLKGGNHTVGETAYEVGYRDISHFSNAFFKYYGHRPKAIIP